MLSFKWASAQSHLSLFVAMSLRAAASNLSLFPNPLSNESVIQDGREHKTVVFLPFNAARKPARMPYKFAAFRYRLPLMALQWALNLAFQRWYTKLKWQWKIAQTCRSTTVSARLRYRVSNSVVFVHPAGMLAKGYPLSKLQNCCHFEIGKYINLVCYSCSKHANEMLLGDPRLTDQRTQSFNFAIVNHQSLDRNAKAPSSLSYMYGLVQWNCFSEVTGYTWVTCIQWRQRTNGFTAPDCTSWYMLAWISLQHAVRFLAPIATSTHEHLSLERPG